jgi:hydrogenase/urease accessory protein HupE
LRVLVLLPSAAAALCIAAQPVFAHTQALERSYPGLAGYFALGIEHILLGIDHLLFLLGLVLIGGRLRDVVLAVTAFTAAHSVSLLLQMAGIVNVQPAWIEIAIALSIAYVGVENLVLRDGSRRFGVAFGFGLIHGLGFASALRETGLPSTAATLSLACFNAGVEAGQLAALALVLPALHWLRRQQRARTYALPAMNASLIAIGLAWCAARLFAPEAAVAAAPSDPRPASVDSTAEPTAQATASVPRSIYPDVGRSHAGVRPLCEALHALPRVRRAQCAGRVPGITLVSECTRVLGSAIEGGGLRLDGAASERCIAAMHGRYAGCAWTKERVLPVLDECKALVTGLRAAGATCRSSLECGVGLSCRGSGPLDAGVCAAPQADGARCGTATDALGAFVPLEEASHRECEGRCVQGRCRSAPR